MKKTTFLLGILITLSSIAFSQQKGYQVGDKAIDFSLKNIDGNMVSLKDYTEAKGFIIVFTCNHCPFAIAYEDRLIALHQKYSSLNYPIVAINSNDPAASEIDNFDGMIQRAKDKGFNFKYLVDETQNIAKAYGAVRTPHVYLLKKEGDNLVVKYIGAIDDNSENASLVKEKYLENAVDALLSKQEIKVTSTKAIGCTIKWKKS